MWPEALYFGKQSCRRWEMQMTGSRFRRAEPANSGKGLVMDRALSRRLGFRGRNGG